MPRSPKVQPTSGVYAITNTATGQVYVGSSVNVRNRWSTHRECFAAGRQQRLMQAEWNRCGEAAFVFSVLEETAADEQSLQAAEQRWLNSFAPDQLYNRARNVGRPGRRPIAIPTSREFSDQISARREPGELDAQLARRLGISRSHWRHIQAGRREVSTAVAARAIALWPELGPLYLAELTAHRATSEVA